MNHDIGIRDQNDDADEAELLAVQPLISVVMAAYNRLEFLKEAVQSVRNQDRTDFEILIVDDGSDGQTKSWLRHVSEQDQRLRVIFQEHAGIGAARAAGVNEARGEYICILDSDDTLVPEALTRLHEVFGKFPETAICHCNISEHRPTGSKKVRQYPVFENTATMIRATLCHPRVPFKHSGSMFRREIALELGSYDPNLSCKVDIDFYLKFLHAGYMPRLVPEALVTFRMHRNSISHGRIVGLPTWYRLIDKYGPPSFLLRVIYKAARTVAEILKLLFVEFMDLFRRCR